MRRLLTLLFCLLCTSPSWAWNAAGHRLSAVIAWQQLSVDGRLWVDALLRQHEDYPRWREKSGTGEPAALFAEAATWADSIRNDRRYRDSRRGEDGTGPDQQRHNDWHYVNLDRHGRPVSGQLDRQIREMQAILRSTAPTAEKAWALPWLLHLVGDIHQPLHVGHLEDRGGNGTQIEDPFNPRQPFIDLHSYWDQLPGPSGLRGKRLFARAHQLQQNTLPADIGHIRQWRDESYQLLPEAYPTAAGTVLPIVTTEFRDQAQAIANRRLVEAGHRLAHLLDDIARVSRGTTD